MWKRVIQFINKKKKYIVIIRYIFQKLLKVFINRIILLKWMLSYLNLNIKCVKDLI